VCVLWDLVNYCFGFGLWLCYPIGAGLFIDRNECVGGIPHLWDDHMGCIMGYQNGFNHLFMFQYLMILNGFGKPLKWFE
jgi:hypothetical protein